MYLPGVACILLLLVCGGMGLKIYFMRKRLLFLLPLLPLLLYYLIIFMQQ